MQIDILKKLLSVVLLLTAFACATTGSKKTYKSQNLDSLYYRAHSLQKATRTYEAFELLADLPWNLDRAPMLKYSRLLDLKYKLAKDLNLTKEQTELLIAKYEKHIYTNKALLFSEINRQILAMPNIKLQSLTESIESYSPYWYAVCSYELANRYLDKGEISKAKDYFENVASLKHPLSIKARKILSYIDEAKELNPFNIGVALELDQWHKVYSERILNGIQLASGIFTQENIPIKLVIVNVSGSNDLIKQRILQSISRDKIIAMLGPSNSKKAEFISKILQSFSVPMLSLSQDANIAKTGDFIFSLAVSIQEQIKTLVSYAINRAYIKDFAVLFPEDRYGKYLTSLFMEEVQRRGANIKAVMSYDDSQVDFRGPVKKLLSMFYMVPRKEEYEEAKEQFKEKYSREPSYTDIELSPIVDFEAVFIPDGAKKASIIAPFFSLYDARVKLLGLNTWYTPLFLKRGGNYINGSILIGGFSEARNPSFVSQFIRVFHRKPSIIEAQGYDAAKIVVSFLKKNGRSVDRDDLKEYLLKLRNFIGAMGMIDIDEFGVARRDLEIYKAYSTRFVKQTK